MKLRNGFVSNSSSTAFVVLFDRPLKSYKDIHKQLFGDLKEILMEHEYIDSKLSSYFISKLLFKKRKAEKFSINSDCSSIVSSRYVDMLCGFIDTDIDLLQRQQNDIYNKARKDICDKHNINIREFWNSEYYKEAEESLKKDDSYLKAQDAQNALYDKRHEIMEMYDVVGFLYVKKYSKLHEKAVCCYEFEDHGAGGIILEQGEYFKNIKHWSMSHH